MQVTYSHCAGIDVHKKMLVVCRIRPDEEGGWQHETRQFGRYRGVVGVGRLAASG